MRLLANATVFVFLIIPLAFSKPSLARDSLSGSWEEEYNETIVSVEQWSPACGPSPKSTGRRKRGLKYRLEDQGIALKFIGSKKTFSTADCQTDNKAVQPKERTVKKNLFMISCSTAEDANPYENGLYSFRIKSPNRIDYRETTRFSRNASGSMCVHTMRIRRVYKKLTGPIEGSKLSDKDSKADDIEPPVQATEPKTDPCSNPGAVVSVFVEPSHLELSPGSKACVDVTASDANACAVAAHLDWAKRSYRPEGVRLLDGRCILVSNKARAGKHKLGLQASGVSVVLDLSIEKRPSKNLGEHSPKQAQSEHSAKSEHEKAQPDAGQEVANKAETEQVQTDMHLGAQNDKPQEPAPNPKEPKSRKPVIKDLSPGTQKPAGSQEPLPSWVMPTAIGAAMVIVLIVLVLVFRKKKAPTAQAAPDLEITASIDQSPPAAAAQDPGPQLAEQPPLVTAPTKVEPLRAVMTDQANQAESSTNSAPSVQAEQAPDMQAQEPSQPASNPATKFCIGCGEELPLEAKFCPYCAQKQE